MDRKDFGGWVRRYLGAFLGTQEWLDKLEAKHPGSKAKQMEAWFETLQHVEIRDAEAVLNELKAGSLGTVPSHSRDTTALLVKSYCDYKRHQRSRKAESHKHPQRPDEPTQRIVAMTLETELACLLQREAAERFPEEPLTDRTGWVRQQINELVGGDYSRNGRLISDENADQVEARFRRRIEELKRIYGETEVLKTC